MTTTRTFLYATLLASLTVLPGCGSSDEPAAETPATETPAVPDPVSPGTVAPGEPKEGVDKSAGGDEVVFAIDSLDLGDADPEAWTHLGLNLDGLISTVGGSNHCKLATGAEPRVKADGKGGIDNAFGRDIIGLIVTMYPELGAEVNGTLAEGQFTVMIRSKGLGTEADQKNVWSALYAGAELANPPKWDGTDVWPYYNELTEGGDKEKPKVLFGKSYVSGGTWVSGSSATITLQLAISGVDLKLDIRGAQIAMKPNLDKLDAATEGVIAGVINTADLISQITDVAGGFVADMCPGNTTFDGITDTIRAASDIMSDGTNGDPTKSCDGISVGIGFTAKAVKLGSGVTAEASEPKYKCP